MSYYTPAQIITRYHELIGAHKDYCTSSSIGLTYQGNKIWMFRIGTDHTTNRILVDASLHGWEDIMAHSMYEYISWLLNSNDAKAKELLKKCYLLVVPQVNYDGALINDRQNLNHEDCAGGVDLNRNFRAGGAWYSIACGGENYSGPIGASESETRAIGNVFKIWAPKAYINGHYGGGPYIYYKNTADYQKLFGSSDVENQSLYEKYAHTLGQRCWWYHGTTGGGQAANAAAASGVSVSFNFEHLSTTYGDPGYLVGYNWALVDPPYGVVMETLMPIMKSYLFTLADYYGYDDDTVNWYDTDWSYRRKITINGNYISGNLINFPFFYKISGVTNAASTGKDIIFTDNDGETRLQHDLDTFSQGTGSVWIKIPTLHDKEDKDIYMYYGNDDGVDQTNINGYRPSSVWEDFIFVCHMNDSGDTQHLKDSTKYNATIHKKYAAKPYMIKTNMGSGQMFKYTDNTIVSSARAPQFNKSIYPYQVSTRAWQTWNYTVSAWVKKGTYRNQIGYIFTKNSGGAQKNHSVEIHTTSVATPPSQISFGISTSKANLTKDLTGFVDERYDYVVLTHTSGSNYTRFYGNGTRDSTYTGGSSLWGKRGMCFSSNSEINIGNNRHLNYPFSGVIDEVRITTAYRYPGWPLTEYNNISSLSKGFYTRGIEESTGEPPVETPSISRLYMIGQGNLKLMNPNYRRMEFIND